MQKRKWPQNTKFENSCNCKICSLQILPVDTFLKTTTLQKSQDKFLHTFIFYQKRSIENDNIVSAT